MASDPIRDTALIPTYFSIVSLAVLVITALCEKKLDEDSAESVEQHIRQHGGGLRFGLQLFRLLLSATLIGVVSAATAHPLATNVVFGYIFLLSVIAAISSAKYDALATRHVNLVLTATLLVYAWRDVFPLATYTLEPQDKDEGDILWLKISLVLAASIIPLFVPKQYKPINPTSPSKIPAPEQTATLFGLMSFSFIDPVLWEAARVPHLSADRLPPLADDNAGEYLREKIRKHVPSFNNPDSVDVGRKHQHIFWTLIYLVRDEYIEMTLTVALHVVLKVVVPLSVNRLLRYLEGDDSSFFRPWFWVLLMFVGPNVASVGIERHMYLATRTMARVDSILCQIIFSHALRVRMKSEGKGAGSLIGRINSLITTDVNNIMQGPQIPYLFTFIPLQLASNMIFLYTILGWSAFVAYGFTVLLLPIPALLARIQTRLQRERMKKTDARVQLVTETTRTIRMVKLFGWESRMSQSIADKREAELQWIKKLSYLDVVIRLVKYVFSHLKSRKNLTLSCQFPDTSRYDACLLFHITVVMKQELKASTVFSSITVFATLRGSCDIIMSQLSSLIVARVSLERVNDFLVDTELLDPFTPAPPSGADATTRPTSDFTPNPNEIVIHEALFTWTAEVNKNPTTSSDRRFVLAVDQETLRFKMGGLNIIVGPTGSGKTSLLMALLGEMHYIPVAKDSYVNLPREGGVAYAAQESWVQNETIRENILFGSPFDEERYNKVIHQCGLERDLELFEAGDSTEVGEKGITLSGGQKARLTLARAVYSTAEILLLDDVLAALDVHTAKWIVDKCFKGDLLKDRTVLLVTHNIPLVAPIANFVVSVKDGKILSQGSLDAALEKDESLAEEVRETAEKLQKEEEKLDDTFEHGKERPGSKGKLIAKEEIHLGRVGTSAAKLYGSAFGDNPVLVCVMYTIGMFAIGGLEALQTWYMGYWARQYELMDPSKVPIFKHLGVYGLLLLASVVVSALTFILFALSALKASKTVHAKLIRSVLTTTLRWLNTTPISRVLARCTGDINSVDKDVPNSIQNFAGLASKMAVKMVVLLFYIPIFIIPATILSVVGKRAGDLYAKAMLSIRRERYDGAFHGIVSIRAYGASASFEQDLRRRVDEQVRIARVSHAVIRWLPTRIKFIGSVFSTALAGYLVYFGHVDPSTAGFALNMGVTFTESILNFLFRLNDIQSHSVSLERINAYLDIEREPGASNTDQPPAYWPASGDLRVENLSARYSLDGPQVLHDLTFHVKAGERVGVVGRTGSGKSSLTLALLRCLYTEGSIFYDSLDTTSLDLDALRSKITIIPQSPDLLSGTLRQNLDPFAQHDDATLNDILRASGLLELQKSKDQDQQLNHLTLDTIISSGGSNLSVGQRQILALGRAILRKSKLLILDEATSAIDYETDAIIQQSLRTELSSDTTVITVAHRLQTIMDYDRIMVLDAGKIVEFDTPNELLRHKAGFLKALVEESADKGVLVDLAGKGK